MKAVFLNNECRHRISQLPLSPGRGALHSPHPAQRGPASPLPGDGLQTNCTEVLQPLAWVEGSSRPRNRCTSFLRVGGNSITWLSWFGRAGTGHLFRWSLCVAAAPEGHLLIALWLCGLWISVAKSKVKCCSR